MCILSSDLLEATRQHLSKFSEWLLSIGEIRVTAILLSELGESNWIRILENFLIRNNSCEALHDLINAVYPNLPFLYKVLISKNVPF